MARECVLALVMVARLATVATGTPDDATARQRVVLADPDLELHHAMDHALAPWQLQVIVEPSLLSPSPSSPPGDIAIAEQRADAHRARFVVWRDDTELVVYDRELGTAERRASRAGVLDPLTAAAAALTIKMMMRLPPPPDAVAAPAPAPAPAPGNVHLGIVRLQAGISTRISRSDTTEASARFAGAAQIRPWPNAEWRLGLAGEGGTATSVSRASFKGTWNDRALYGLVSWAHARHAWEVEPHVAAGLRWSALDGTEMSVARRETAALAMAGGGLWVRWRRARWTLGGGLDADKTFGAPTYTKANTPALVFQVPDIAIELGVVGAVDL